MNGFEALIFQGVYLKKTMMGFDKGQRLPAHCATPYFYDQFRILQNHDALQNEPLEGYDWVLIEECRAKGLPYPYPQEGVASQGTLQQEAQQATEQDVQVSEQPPVESEQAESPKKRGRPAKAVDNV
jgi:hypothetical protein